MLRFALSLALLTILHASVALAGSPPARTLATAERVLSCPTGGSLGIVLQKVEQAIAAQLGLRNGQGALVMQVVKNQAGYKAGLKKYDVITHLNGKAVSARSLQAALKKYYPVALRMSENYSAPLLLDLLIKWPTLKKLQHQKDSYLEKFFRAHNCRNAEKIQERIQTIRDAKPLTTDPGVLLPQSMLVQQLVKLLRELQKTITAYDREIAKSVTQNDEAILFGKIRGVGQQLAPRLAAAFGTNRERFQNAGEIQAYAGIAPVTRRSGKKHRVTRRYACPKFLRQTFHEFAEQMRKYSTWSKAYYESQRERGKTHHVAVRALAFKWIRILYAVWETGIPYDEERYIQQLKNRNSPLAKRLSENSTQTA